VRKLNLKSKKMSKSNNIHVVDLVGDQVQIGMFSDLHWDNPKTRLDVLKRDLEHCKKNNIPMFFNGDTFCLMQGRGDRRGNKSDIRPEHNNAFYFDSIVNTAVDFFLPYADHIIGFGQGNHECYHGDTEVLTTEGWVNIKDVTTDHQVYAFNKKYLYHEKPNAVVSKQVDRMVLLEGSYSRQFVSEKHAVVLSDMSKVNAIDVEGLKDRDLPLGMVLKDEFDYPISSRFVELLTAVVSDATLVDHSKYNEGSNKRRVQFKISKPEKIAYLIELLNDNAIKYTFKEATKSGINKLQPYYIRIYGDDARLIFEALNGVKQLPEAFKYLQGEHFSAMMRGIEKTDGHRNGSSIEWNTTSKHDVDVVQTAAIFNGFNFSFKQVENGGGFATSKTQYRCLFNESITNNRKLKKEVFNEPQTVYCLNMPSGNFVTRYKGKVAFSGNTGIIKHQETDILQRFVDLLNAKANTKIQVGGYGGWIVVRQYLENSNSAKTWKIKYFHGSGGGGIVTKGAINLTRALELYEGFDVFTMGHIHENSARTDVRDTVVNHSQKGYYVEHKYIHMMLTGTYKEEYGNGSKGWHVERGAPPKPIGGRILQFTVKRVQKDNVRAIESHIDSIKFPL